MEPIGLQAKFELQEYDANAAKYIRSQAEATTATERASAAMTQAGTGAEKAAKGYNVFSVAANGVVRGVTTVAVIIGRVLQFMANLATMAFKVAAALTIVAFAIGKLDKLLLWIAEITKKIPAVSNLFKQLAKDYQAVGGSAGAADSLAKRLVAVVGVGTAIVSLRNIWKALRGDIDANTRAVDNVSRSIANLPKQAMGLNVISVAIGSALGGIAMNAINNVIGGIQNLSGNVQNFGKEAVFGAARAREFMSVLYMMGAKQGITSQSINESVQAIRSLGIEMSVAQNLIQQAIRYNVDLATAQKLARIAQDAAVVGQMNSSEALDRLIWGMTTQQTEVLRTMGLNVRFDEAYQNMAKSVGSASDALTTNQRIMAAANAIIKEGSTIAGAYETAQKDASKELRSFPRYIDDIKIAMGAPFLGAFDNVVFGLKNMLKTVQQLVTTKGPIQDFLYTLGGLASVITEPFLNAGKAISAYFAPAMRDMAGGTKFALKNMTETAQGEGRTFLSNLVSTFSQSAESALRWGVEIVANLAEGMAQGAAWALTNAMNVIGNMLSSWLSPGSPPRVAPNIDKWGMATINEWLHGFGEADFNLLGAIQAPLKQVLDVVGKSADFSALSAGLIESIKEFSSTGAVNEAIFQQLANLGGVYGQELAELTALQFAYAKAVKETEEADKKYVDSQNKVSNLTAEYNKMMRSGASQGALKAKLAEINAAEKARDAAAKDKVASTEKAMALKQQADLQGKLLSQLVELARAQEKARQEADKPTAAGGKAGAIADAIGGAIEMPEIEMKGINIAKPIDEALEKAKKRIQEKLADIFKPLTAKWEKSIKPALEGVVSKFEWFKNIVKRAWDAIVKAAQPIIDKIKQIVPPDMLNRIGQAVGVFLVFAAAITVVSTVVTIVGGIIGAVLAALLSPIGLIIAGVVALKLAWDNNFMGIRDTLTNLWENVLVPTFTKLWDWLSVNIPAAIVTAQEFIGNLRQRFVDVWTFIDTKVIPIFKGVAHVLEAILYKAFEAVHGFIDKNINPVLKVMHEWFANNIEPKLIVVTAVITALVKDALEPFANYMNNTVIPALKVFLESFLNPINAALENLKKMFEAIPASLGGFADGIRNMQLPWWLTPGSQTPLEEGIAGIGSAAVTTGLSIFGSDTSLGAAMTNVSTLLKTDLLLWLGEDQGLIYTLEMVKQIAAASMGTMAEPLEEAFYVIRAAAADAAAVVLSVVNELESIKAMDGLTTHIWIITHHKDVIEPPEDKTGGSGGGPKGRQHGGPTYAGGWYYTHPDEWVISAAQRMGAQPVPNDVFSRAALMRMGVSVPSQVNTTMNSFSITVPNATISSNMDIRQVSNQILRQVKDGLRRR